MNVGITLYLSPVLLKQIETHVKGKNRTEKLRKCLTLGYPLAVRDRQPPPIPTHVERKRVKKRE